MGLAITTQGELKIILQDGKVISVFRPAASLVSVCAAQKPCYTTQRWVNAYLLNIMRIL